MMDMMQEFLLPYYEWIRALHIIAVMAWMAGMLYLPRLFVYHAQEESGSETSETFKVMERRLLKFIMNPAMIASWIFGLMLLAANTALLENGWMHAKLTAIVLMSGVHGMLAARVKKFAAGANTRSARYFRILNEVPTALMIVIVIMAVVQPF